MQLNTRIIHSVPVDPLTGAVSVPIYQTSTYVQESPGQNKGFDYSRTNNPTRQVLEGIIAELEGGALGCAFSSGLAAVDAVLKLLDKDSEVVAVDDIYGGTFRAFTHIYQKFGVRVNYVDTTNLEEVAAAIGPKTRLVWLETPTNPTLKVSDIARVAELAHKVGALLVVDNTFASPVLQRPLELGADIVLHSATKYLGGHSDLIAGLVVTADRALGEQIKFIQNATGAVLGPWDAWLTIRGIETLDLRVRQHSANALEVARFLEASPLVDKVFYPGLPSHKNHELARRQQNGRFGGVVAFSLKHDSLEEAIALVTSTKLFKLAESLGGIKSLVCHPATMTHKSIPVENRRRAGVSDSLVRLSVGLEDAADLLADLAQALEALAKRHQPAEEALAEY